MAEAFGDDAKRLNVKLQNAAKQRSRRYSSSLDQLKEDQLRSRSKSKLLRRLSTYEEPDTTSTTPSNFEQTTTNKNVHKLSILPLHSNTLYTNAALPRRLVRKIASGLSTTLLCTIDGGCYQFGSLGGITSPPQQIPQFQGLIVVHVAVGMGSSKHDPILASSNGSSSSSSKGGEEEEEDESSGGSGFHGFDNEDHLCVLTTEDEHNLWTWGGNDHGQLGRGTAGVFGWRPEQVSFGADHHERISYVDAGLKYTIAVSECNHVWSWGLNMKGQLGIGTFQTVSTGEGSLGKSIFNNPTGDHDIEAPMLVQQLEHGNVKDGEDDGVNNPFSAFGAAVFNEEHVDGSTEMKYQRRQRLVATGTNHAMLW